MGSGLWCSFLRDKNQQQTTLLANPALVQGLRGGPGCWGVFVEPRQPFPVLHVRTDPFSSHGSSQGWTGSFAGDTPKVEEHPVPTLLCYQHKTQARQRKSLLSTSISQSLTCLSRELLLVPEPAALGKQEVVKTSWNEIFFPSSTFPGPRSFRLFPALYPEVYILLLFAARMKGDINPVFEGGARSPNA